MGNHFYGVGTVADPRMWVGFDLEREDVGMDGKSAKPASSILSPIILPAVAEVETNTVVTTEDEAEKERKTLETTANIQFFDVAA